MVQKVRATLKWGKRVLAKYCRSNVPNFKNEGCPALAILTMVVAVVDSTYSAESSWTTGAVRRVCMLMGISSSIVYMFSLRSITIAFWV